MSISINDIFITHGENEEIVVRSYIKYRLVVSDTSIKSSSVLQAIFRFQNDIWWHSKLELVQVN